MPKYGTVVADAGPLISLEKISEGFSLLQHACSRLLVPRAVLNEVSLLFLEDLDYLSHHRLRAFVDVEVVSHENYESDQEFQRQIATLGPGERSALEAAKARRIPILVEERRARRVAHDMGLLRFGAAAVIKMAYEEKGIDLKQAEDCLQQLMAAN